MEYLLKRGRFNRYEKGILKKYKVGDKVELTEKEADDMRSLIGPVTTHAATTPPPPVMRHIVPTPSPEEMSGIAMGDVGTTSPLERDRSFRKRDHGKLTDEG